MSSSAVLVAPPFIQAPSMSPCLTRALDPVDHCAWTSYVQAQDSGTVFHTLGWRDAVASAFKHEPLYFVARRGERVAGVLPTFFVRSRIGGPMLVSVPYAVGGGIVADDVEAREQLFDAARVAARDRRCRWIDLRSEQAVIPGLPIVDRYVNFRRTLPDRVEDVLGWLPRKARAAARNARNKFKLEVDFGAQHLHEVWRLYSISMRRLGSLAYPFRFFEALVDEMPERAWVSIVRREGRPIAGLVSLMHRDRIIPYFIGTTDDARHYSAANFIYLTLMERAVASGYRVFDFGRSRRDNTGSFDFKRFHGFAPTPLSYQRCLLTADAAPDLSPNNPKFRLGRRIWRYLPLSVTRILGAEISKHIPG